MRLLIIQYGGDYREAYQRLANGGEETYGFQKYSVDYVANLTEKLEEVTTICVCSETQYNELLKPKLRAIGLGLTKNYDKNKIKQDIEKYIRELKPDRLILRFPSQEILSLAIKYKIPTLAMFADYIANKTIKQKIKKFFLANSLNNQQIEWISNHGIYSSETLYKIGVKAKKIIPWDYPFVNTDDNFMVKNKPKSETNISLLYCGAIAENKGVGDVINALSILKQKSLDLTLNILGGGNIERFTNLVQTLKIENQVNFLGLIPHSQIVKRMKNADLVVIPTRKDYPEGFPLTIYEGLMSGTPIIVSDHPVFMSKLKNEENAMIFPSGDYVALSESIKKVIGDEELYHKLSLNSYDTWLSLQIPCKFHDLIDNWLFNQQDRDSFLSKYNLPNY